MDKSLDNIASAKEKKMYLLKTEEDYKILDLIHQLEAKKLSSRDLKLVKFVRTQLYDDWRTPVIKFLKDLLRKYK